MAGMNFATQGIADRLLGMIGVDETSRLRSDRVWAVIIAAATVLGQFLTGPEVSFDQLFAAVQSLVGDNGWLGTIALGLGAFGVGRSNESARTF